jgi:hypothetical protein
MAGTKSMSMAGTKSMAGTESIAGTKSIESWVRSNRPPH